MKTIETLQKTKKLRGQKFAKGVLPNSLSQSYIIEGKPSVIALKIFHIFLDKASDKIIDDTSHHISLNEISHLIPSGKFSSYSLELYFKDLAKTIVIFRTPDVIGVSPLISYAYATRYTNGEVILEYKFGHVLRAAYKNSPNYTMLDLPYVMRFKKRYTIRLYMLICSLINLKKSTQTFEFDEMRLHLGVPLKSSYTNANLIYDCILPALKEINEIPYIDINFHSPKHGQKFTNLVFSWDTHYKRRFIKKDHLGKSLGNSVLE